MIEITVTFRVDEGLAESLANAIAVVGDVMRTGSQSDRWTNNFEFTGPKYTITKAELLHSEEEVGK